VFFILLFLNAGILFIMILATSMFMFVNHFMIDLLVLFRIYDYEIEVLQLLFIAFLELALLKVDLRECIFETVVDGCVFVLATLF